MSDPAPVQWDEMSILAHLKQIAQDQLNLTPQQIAEIDPDAPLLDSLQLDSLAQVVLMSTIEKDFGCVFDPEQLQKIETLRDLVRMIELRLSGEAVR